jgi:hypothetical protein
MLSFSSSFNHAGSYKCPIPTRGGQPGKAVSYDGVPYLIVSGLRRDLRGNPIAGPCAYPIIGKDADGLAIL